MFQKKAHELNKDDFYNGKVYNSIIIYSFKNEKILYNNKIE